MEPPCPDTIGEFQILGLLAVGGMGEVFAGVRRGRLHQGDPSIGFRKLVAIKRLLPRVTEDQVYATMFIDEARNSLNLSHDGIAQVFDVGLDQGSYYMAMEYIFGMRLWDVAAAFHEANRALSPALCAHVMARVCSSLDYLHGRGIIHRDIGPQNVMVTPWGDVKLIDLGVAKARSNIFQTELGLLKGKISYMSPEQARGGQIDHRSDIFSVGTTLFFLVTGTNPFHQNTDEMTLIKVAAAEIPKDPPPGVPVELYEICRRAMARSPNDRFRRASEMMEALETFHQRALYGRAHLVRELSWVMSRLDPNRNPNQLLKQHRSAEVPQMQGETTPAGAPPSVVARKRETSRRSHAVSGTAGPHQESRRSLSLASSPYLIGGICGVLGTAMLVLLVMLFASC